MIRENIEIVRNQIEAACKRAGRSSNEITLVAVSKTFSVNEINEAEKAGLKIFGENKAQELLNKFEILKDSVIWHFIGTLQSNKAKFVVPCAEYIHSVDSLKLLKEIEKNAIKINKVQKFMLEIKTSFEESKHGLNEESEIIEILDYAGNSKNLSAEGLMTIAPFVDDEKLIRKSFRSLRELKEKLNSKGFILKELSMGMTGDFEIAIEEGSTMVRIGSAIFGTRNYN